MCSSEMPVRLLHGPEERVPLLAFSDPKVSVQDIRAAFGPDRYTHRSAEIETGTFNGQAARRAFGRDKKTGLQGQGIPEKAL